MTKVVILLYGFEISENDYDSSKTGVNYYRIFEYETVSRINLIV